MAKITYDFQKILGRIKPMHGVGQPPMIGIKTDYFKYLKEANIPYSRLHDVGGRFGGGIFVDIPNIFRDFDADETDSASYDFVFTDILIKGLMEYECEPVFRLGVTIENNHHLRAYHIFPPKDMAKWARVCEHIIRHYTEGWADGFHYDITYWEIWNEPDNGIDERTNMMWHGTKEEYFEMYRVTSKHLKACFGDKIKVGGYSSSGFYAELKERTKNGAIAMGLTTEPTDWELRITYFVDFFREFLEMVSKENLPLDFYSHHSYENVEKTLIMQQFVENELEKYGLGDVEIHLNEWNPNAKMDERGTALACATAAAMMCEMQNHKMAMMNYYDAQIGRSVYGGLFHPMTYKPLCAWYGFKAFGELYVLGQQASCECQQDKLYVLAATDGTKKGTIIVNLGDDVEVTTNLDSSMSAYVIDDDTFFEKTEIDVTRFHIKTNQVLYIEG